MRNATRLFAVVALLTAGTAAAAPLAIALPAPPTDVGPDLSTVRRGADVQFDLEIDPVAYIASGYSLRAGLNVDRFRFDVGAFGSDMLEIGHDHTGFEVHLGGLGMKVDIFLDRDHRGLFAGLQGAVSRVDVMHVDSREAMVGTQINLGGRVGYRWVSDLGLYVSPWVGVDYVFGGPAGTLGGERFESSKVAFYPTVHLGYLID